MDAQKSSFSFNILCNDFQLFYFSKGPQLQLVNPLTIAEDLGLQPPRRDDLTGRAREQAADFTMFTMCI